MDFRQSFEGSKAKCVLLTVRAALTGRLRGAELTAIIDILGKERAIKRIEKALES